MPKEPYVLRIRAQDRAGVLAAITTAFSSRGVSLDSVLAVAPAAHSPQEGQHISLSFHATQDKRRELCRVLERMNGVTEVVAEPLASPRVVAIAVTPKVHCGTPQELEASAPGSDMIFIIPTGDPESREQCSE